tara:strand:- start:149 stop:790 length:642 start_codon:yes stop_codon:yes gene_type:complete
MLIKKCVLLFSGNGSNLENLLKNQFLHIDKLKYISAFTNNSKARGIDVCKSFNLEVVTSLEKDPNIDLKAFLKKNEPDLIVLSGYMKIIPDDIVKEYKGKIINIHPSLLPKYPGLNTYKKVIDNNDKKHGVTIHFVTEELDGGPIILQGKFNIDEPLNEGILEVFTHKLEYEMFPKVIMWFADGIIKLESNKVLFKDKEINSPIIYITSIKNL